VKIIIIGGVAAGMSAASKIRRLNEGAEVTVYEKGRFLSYGACGLPYYISGDSDDYRKLIARTEEQFAKMGIRAFTRHEVVKVVPSAKQVMVKNLDTGKVFLDRYDRLMIATGSRPVVPPVKGRDLAGVHVLKSLEDGIALRKAARDPAVRDVAIIGGGYIGIETAEAMVQLGKRVRIIEMGDRILRTFEPEMTALAEKELADNGVNLHLSERVEEITGTGGKASGVRTDKGAYPADLVLMAAGMRPATDFLRGTGLMMADNGAIIIDREMRTSLPDIYAAGDCAVVYSRVAEENTYIPLGTTANKMGRLAGVNLLGGREKFIGTLGSAAVKVFGLEMARTGLSEEEAKKLAVDYGTVVVTASDHPAYYPDPTDIVLKLIYEKKTGVLLGAQGVGRKGVVLRIDVFAVAIHNRMTAQEMGMVDLCYAPPFAGVWDAVHIACNAVKQGW
jgi:NADPH-dependent 2,4-dienoyl-CoA reductase/sulfur reductase-like enzyme